MAADGEPGIGAAHEIEELRKRLETLDRRFRDVDSVVSALTERLTRGGAEGDGDAAPDFKQIKKRLDMLDKRFDNVDSVVSALAERIMKQPITFNTTCSKCGHKIEIAVIGSQKPSR